MQERAEAYQKAAVSTRAMEDELALADQVDMTKLPLETRVGRALHRGGHKISDLTAKWDEKKQGVVHRKEFAGRLVDLGITVLPGETDRLFDSLVARLEHEGRSTERSALDVKRAVKMLFELVQSVAKAESEDAKKIAALKSVAKRHQAAVHSADQRYAEYLERSAEQTAIRAEEKAAKAAQQRANKKAMRAKAGKAAEGAPAPAPADAGDPLQA